MDALFGPVPISIESFPFDVSQYVVPGSSSLNRLGLAAEYVVDSPPRLDEGSPALGTRSTAYGQGDEVKHGAGIKSINNRGNGALSEDANVTSSNNKAHNNTDSNGSSSSSSDSGVLKPVHGSRVDGKGSLLGPPRLQSGLTSVSISIEKLGLKDAPVYVEPYLSVYVVNARGDIIGPVQDTPFVASRTPQYLNFKTVVHLQTPLETIVDKNYAVMFEFKHYKTKENYVSTRYETSFHAHAVGYHVRITLRTPTISSFFVIIYFFFFLPPPAPLLAPLLADAGRLWSRAS